MTTDEEDGWRHLLDQERGKRRGEAEKMLRFLNTAKDALTANEPAVTLERIEECIEILLKVKQCK